MPLNDLLAALFGFSKANDMQQFAIETFVQAVAVIGKRQLQQVFRRQQFKKGNQLVVILRIVVPQWFFIVPDIKISELYLLLHFSNKRFSYFLIEEVGGFPG